MIEYIYKMIEYESEKGYLYKIMNGGGVRRISKAKKVKRGKVKSGRMPKIGDKVEIIIKPYKKNKLVKGEVKRVLTKKKVHTRGHKVELKDGTIGRIIKYLDNK